MSKKIKYILYGLTEEEIDNVLPLLTEKDDGEIILIEDEHSLSTMLTHIPEADTMKFYDEVLYIHHNIVNSNIFMCKLISVGKDDGNIKVLKTLNTYDCIESLVNEFVI